MASTAYDVFAAYARLAGYEDDAMIRDIFKAASPYFAQDVPFGDILNLMAVDNTAPQSYKNFTTTFNKIRQGSTGITTIAEYNNAKKVYKTLLSQRGLEDVATDANIEQFLLNNVSADEAAARIDTAYFRIKNADDALKQQLATYFPNVSDADLVRNILGVGKTVDELQKQISIAGIKAEEATAGIKSNIGAEELYKQGVTRDVARKGYQQLAQELPATTAAAQRAGISTQDLQTELEKENLLGMASQRRKKIQTAEQNLFQGSSGTAGISLGKSSVGRI